MSWFTRTFLKQALAGVVALVGSACSVPNTSHCGNQSGDATCLTRDPSKPHCNLCEAVNDGCVAEPVASEACHMASDSGVAATTTTTGTSTTAPTTSTSTSTTEAPTTSTSTSTTDATSTSTSTSTTTGTSAETDTSTTSTSTETGTGTESSTTGTTDMTSGTGSSTTMVEPLCGDGVIDPGETCDTNNLKGKACEDYMNLYGGGTLKCNANCNSFDFTGCCKLLGVTCVGNGECCNGTCVFDLLGPDKCN